MINKVTLVGRAGKDPEVRHFENNQKVANFTLATDYTYKNKNGEKVTETEWHNLVIWGTAAEIAEKYIKKGKLLYVEGRIRSRSYDGQDGAKRYITEIMVDNFQLLSPKEGGSSAPIPETAQTAGSMNAGSSHVPDATFSVPTAPSDDLPF
jgi:single-strand DNA-binding protein